MLGAVALALALLWPSGSPSSDVRPADRVVLQSAEFASGDAPQWTPVALPDTWHLRGLPTKGQGRYRLHFTLPEAPAATWAARIDRITAAKVVRVNGRVLLDHGMPEAVARYTRPLPDLVPVPEGFLRAGENTLELDVAVGSGAGLSPIELGPMQALEPGYAWYWNLSVGLPQMLNVAGGGLALFMALVWWQRRSEVAIGTFGLIWILQSIRNINYYPSGAPLPPDLANWFFFSIHAWNASLMGLLAMELAKLRWRWYARVLLAVAVLWPTAGAVMISLGQPVLLRQWAYPPLYVVTLIALWLLFKAARGLRGRHLAGVAAAFAAMLTTNAHDTLSHFGMISVMQPLWQPFGLPIVMAAFAWLLVRRLVRALAQEERRAVVLEHRVAQRTAALQAANATKTRFLAAASHDLRQPVVTIGLLVGLLREQISAPALRGMIDRVDEAVASLEALLKGLLDLSRLDSGTVKPRMERVALQPLFDAIATHEREAAQLKGLRLRLRPTRLAVMSDPLLLEQIMRNLVSNGLRYSDRGGVLVSARRRGAHRVLLQVWDTGRGIPPQQQAAVFEEFVQLDNEARDSKRGLGLGLAIVKRCVRLLGCTLQMRSQSGRGTCFSIELPVTEEAGEALAPSAAATRPLAAWRVVVVEDDTAVREALGLRLKQWGAQVLAFDGAASLKEALRTLPQRVDLVVTDNRLPSGNAMQVVELVRQHAGAVPALVVTGDTSPQEIAALIDTGLPVLHKPFRAEQLLLAIEAARQTTPFAAAAA
ncbi:MAG: response regulator [Betaproteobacteria bacterium]|nr:MAG: response regulator [Betaproteobacteria bacterium]